MEFKFKVENLRSETGVVSIFSKSLLRREALAAKTLVHFPTHLRGRESGDCDESVTPSGCNCRRAGGCGPELITAKTNIMACELASGMLFFNSKP